MPIILLVYAGSIEPTTINGRFIVNVINNSRVSVLLQINTNSGTDDLGGTTIVISFDTTSLSITEHPVQNEDYVFHNFSDGNYSPATVTKPMKDKIWINIDLPFTNSNNGTVVSANPEWTNLVTVYFNVLDPSQTPNFTWLTSSLFWGIFDADNTAFWETGEFEDYPTSVQQDPEVPTSFELLQNFPNPFNPSTKIVVKLPVTAHIKLTVYNLLGEVVNEIANSEYIAGTHEFTFLADGLASGVYIYRVESTAFTETKKMVLLR
jgi:hypothetical protein